MSKLRCTYCDGDAFLEGPSGGLSTNILCANLECRHWFNTTPMGLEDLKKIEPTKEEGNESKRKIALHIKEREDYYYEEGRSLCREEKSLLEGSSISYEGDHNLFCSLTKLKEMRMIGFLDELQARHQ